MSSPIDAAQYIIGKIEAVELLVSALAAQLSPAVASVLLSQCAALREKAAKGGQLSSYEEGFLSVEPRLLQAVKQAADAEKVRGLQGNAKH